jgi:hypothetical protein
MISVFRVIPNREAESERVRNLLGTQKSRFLLVSLRSTCRNDNVREKSA